MLVAKQNNELLLKNYQTHPIGTMSYPEMNTTNSSGFHGHRRLLTQNKFQFKGSYNRKFHHYKWIRDETKQDKGKMM